VAHTYFEVTYFDVDDVEMSCLVNADDESAALGVVLDMLGDTIADDSPFSVWRDSSAAKRHKGKRGDMLIGPFPYEGDSEDSTPIPTQKLSPKVEARPSAETAKLLAEVAAAAGAELQR
jgi:hypothetical protein